MSRRRLILFAAVCLCASFFMWFGISNLLEAQDFFKRTAGSSNPAAVQAQMAAKIKQALTAKEWTVYVVKVAATRNSSAVVETDVLTFTDRTVISKNLVAAGYSKTGSNYALRVGSDGASVWETMQMHENEKDMVFLRGELPPDCGSMIGSMTYQSPKGMGKTDNFSTYMPASLTSDAAMGDAQQTTTVTTTTGGTRRAPRTRMGR